MKIAPIIFSLVFFVLIATTEVRGEPSSNITPAVLPVHTQMLEEVKPAGIKDIKKDFSNSVRRITVDCSHFFTQMFEVAKATGIKEAEKDFSNGIYRIQVYGLRASGRSRQETYLKENYGIEIWPVAGCLLTQDIRGRAEGYNTRMKELLLVRFGKDVFAEAEKEAYKPRNRPTTKSSVP